VSKEDKKPEKERKMRPEMCLEKEPAETARKRTTTISQNSRMPLQTKPRKNKPIHNRKREYDLGINKRPQ
jgi:hypothetical protein